MSRKTVILLMVFLGTSVSSSQWVVSVGGTTLVSIPVGDASKKAGIGGGGAATVEFLFEYTDWAITGTLGYIVWMRRTERIVDMSIEHHYSGMPLRVGGRYYFEEKGLRPYVQLEVGADILIGDQRTVERRTPIWGGMYWNYEKVEEKEDAVMVLAPSGGIVWEMGDLQLDGSLAFQLADMDGRPMHNVLFRAGVRFSFF